MSYGPSPRCIHDKAIAETFSNCDSCRLQRALDLLRRWRRAVAVIYAPDLHADTTVLLADQQQPPPAPPPQQGEACKGTRWNGRTIDECIKPKGHCGPCRWRRPQGEET